MSNPKELKYTKDHEWVKVEGIKATVGITDHAQEMLGDVVFVELPELDTECSAQESVANIESVKAVSEVFSPVSGKIVEVNSELEDAPDNINKGAFKEGWIYKVELSDPSELDALMTADQYDQFLAEEE